MDRANLGAQHASLGQVFNQLAVEQVDVANEVGNKAAGWKFINIVRFAHLQHAAFVHHGHA